MRRPWKAKPCKTLESQKAAEIDMGLKTLYDSRDCDVECVPFVSSFDNSRTLRINIVAVHGLGGNHLGCWTAGNGLNWLTDLLPLHMPNARVLTYGYDSTAHSSQHITQKILYARSRSLVANLNELREKTHTERRPVIFVAHSLGGILVKSALIQAEWAKLETNDENLYAIRLSTAGVVFLGTPHRGSPDVPWRKVLEDVVASELPKARGIAFLEKDSDWLETHLEPYKSISQHIRTYYCYETIKSASLTPPALIVPRTSACPSEHVRCEGEVVAFTANHRDLSKFTSAEDSGYQAMLACLRDFHRLGPAVSKAWNLYKQDSVSRQTRNLLLKDDNYRLPVHLPHCRNKRFIGREPYLDDIHRKFFSGTPKEHGTIVALCGIGGIGKSQLALEYAYRHSENYSAILWIEAKDQCALQATFLGSAQYLIDHYALQLEDSEQPYSKASSYLGLSTIVDQNGRIIPEHGSLQIISEAVIEWLSRAGNNQWLLIVDDADEVREAKLSSYLPSVPWGRKLFTSRSRICSQCADLIDVSPLSAHEALTLFSAHSGEPMRARAKNSINYTHHLLERFPQQVVYAAGYDNILLTSPKLLELGSQKTELEDSTDKAKILDELSVFHSACSSVAVIDPLAKDLLFQCSVFDSKDIPLGILRERYDPFDNEAPCLGQLATLLESRSLIIQSSRANCVSILPRLHKRLHNMQSNEDLRKLVKQGSTMIAMAIKRLYVSSAGAEAIWRMERHALPHVESCLRWTEQLWPTLEIYPDHKLRIAWTILGAVCERQHRFEKARRFATLAAQGADVESMHIGLRLETNRILRNSHEQRRAPCISIHDDAKVRPCRDPICILATLDLATLYEDQARFKQAASVYKNLLSAIEEIQGPNSQDAIQLVGNIAQTYQRMGRSEKSEALYERQMLALEGQYGAESPITRNISHNLIQACQLQGEYSRAAELVRREIRADLPRLGRDHPTVLRELGHLAMLEDEQGHFKISNKLFLETIAGFEKTCGIQHPDTLDMCENLALSYRLRGRYDDAIFLLRRTLTMRKLFHHERSDLIRTVERFSAILEERGEREEAQKLWDEVPQFYQSDGVSNNRR